MIDTQARWLAGIASSKDRETLRQLIQPIGDRMSSQAVTNSTLVIKTGGSAVAKTGAAASYYLVNGALVTIAAATDMPALSGSITAASYNVFCFFVDNAGTKTSAMGTEATTLKGVEFPVFPVNKALVGFLIVTYSSTFVGGTTALDTATTVYISPVGAFDPTVLPG